MTDKLNEVFNLQPQESQRLLREVQSEDDDYELARTTLREVISQGRNALDDVISLARSSEHPRSYEVAGQIMKTMSDVAKDLLTLKQQKFDLENPKGSSAAAAQIAQQNNIVFAGSTEDLLRMIKQQDTKTIDSE